MPLLRTAGAAALAAAVAGLGLVGVVGCTSSAAADGRITVVASTDVYGDLAAAVGGRAVAVTSLVTSAAQDPHSYEASAHDELALSRADVVIENGGGYDDFVDRLRSAAGGHATVLNALELSGLTAPQGGELNEHVWYDAPSMRRLVARLVTVLSNVDPGGARGFAERGHELSAGIAALQRTEARLNERYGGTAVAITEPVPLYLLDACGLINRTPEEFSAALEEGTGVPAGVLKSMLDLFAQHRVRALVYNAQTSGPETDQLLDGARSAGIPTVPVTETLPAGQHYLSWMRTNLADLTKALA
jgi:zinc/manganese transport system substrate-binding protein